jgi:hypothetical protein
VMSDKDNTYTFTLGVGQITVVLIALKLFDQINWSWWWVFSPIWIWYGALFALAIVLGTTVAIKEWNDNERR